MLREPLVAANAVRPPNLPPHACGNCGVVEAINAIEVKGEGGYLGLVGGGVAGAVLGSQVGNGNGRTAAQLLGAVGGALVFGWLATAVMAAAAVGMFATM